MKRTIALDCVRALLRRGLAAWPALAVALSLALTGAGPVAGQTLGQHCYDVGPLPGEDPDWCGCTWGGVYVDRQPVAGAQVVLTFDGRTLATTSRAGSAEAYPYYALSANELGAKYGDVVTLTVSYRGQTLNRTLRLLPGANDEQQASVVFSASGHWQRWSEQREVRTLAAAGGDLWVGSAAGLMHWDVSRAVSETVATPLSPPGIQALAVGVDGALWAGGRGGLARLANGAWTQQSPGLASANITALAMAGDGSVWAGASDPVHGGVSRFDGAAWTPHADFNGGLPNLVLALAADGDGGVWVGTDDAGVSRWDGAAWRTFGTADGLASNIVWGIAAGDSDAWFATLSYFDGVAWRGGVGRYHLDSGLWNRYTTAEGLAFEDVAAVALDAAGRPWFGTWGGGLSLFDGRNWWQHAQETGLASDYVRALAVGPDGSVWAGGRAGIDRFRPGPGGAEPEIEEVEVEASDDGAGFSFEVSAEDDGRVVGYEWQSDRDGALGSERAYSVRQGALTRGRHRITVRVQDDEGNWSEAATAGLTVVGRAVFLPLLVR